MDTPVSQSSPTPNFKSHQYPKTPNGFVCKAVNMLFKMGIKSKSASVKAFSGNIRKLVRKWTVRHIIRPPLCSYTGGERRDRAPRVELFPLSYTHDRFSLLLLVDNSGQLSNKEWNSISIICWFFIFFICVMESNMIHYMYSYYVCSDRLVFLVMLHFYISTIKWV